MILPRIAWKKIVEKIHDIVIRIVIKVPIYVRHNQSINKCPLV